MNYRTKEIIVEIINTEARICTDKDNPISELFCVDDPNLEYEDVIQIPDLLWPLLLGYWGEN